MTPAEIIYSLKNDFPFLVEVIAENNPTAVNTKLNQYYQGDYESPLAMQQVILEMDQAGQIEAVQDILSVPFNEARATPELIQAYNQIEMQAMAQGKFSDWSGGMFDALGLIGASAVGGASTGVQAGGVVVLPQPPKPAEKKSNTIWYILGGIVLIVIVAVIIMARRNKSK